MAPYSEAVGGMFIRELCPLIWEALVGRCLWWKLIHSRKGKHMTGIFNIRKAIAMPDCTGSAGCVWIGTSERVDKLFNLESPADILPALMSILKDEI